MLVLLLLEWGRERRTEGNRILGTQTAPMQSSGAHRLSPPLFYASSLGPQALRAWKLMLMLVGLVWIQSHHEHMEKPEHKQKRVFWTSGFHLLVLHLLERGS